MTGSPASRRTGRSTMRFGIGHRFMLGLTVLLIAVIGGITWQSDYSFQQRSARQLDSELRGEVREYDSYSSVRPASQTAREYATEYLTVQARNQAPATLVAVGSAGPTVLTTPAGAWLRSNPVVQAWLANPPATATYANVEDGARRYRVLASPVTYRGVREGTLVAAADLAELQQSLRSQALRTAGESLLALIVAVAGGYLLFRRVLRLLGRVTTTAKKIAGGDLSLRLQYTGPQDELSRLARTVDGMLDRLEAAFTSQRQLLADVSHQLRTPLTIIRGHLDVLNRGEAPGPADVAETVGLVIDELDQLALLIERLLLLGRALEQDFLTETPVDLPVLIADVYEAAQFLGKRAWELGPVPAVTVLVDRPKLRAVLLNLADNAVKATREGQHIRLAAQREPSGELVLLVSDGGRGLSREQQHAVRGRFVRTESSTYRGSGLGLAIAHAVAEAHRGRLEIDSTLGVGTTVRIVLPGWRVVSASLAGSSSVPALGAQ